MCGLSVSQRTYSATDDAPRAHGTGYHAALAGRADENKYDWMVLWRGLAQDSQTRGEQIRWLCPACNKNKVSPPSSSAVATNIYSRRQMKAGDARDNKSKPGPTTMKGRHVDASGSSTALLVSMEKAGPKHDVDIHDRRICSNRAAKVQDLAVQNLFH